MIRQIFNFKIEKIIKKTLKIIRNITLIFFGLLLSLYLIFRLPAVQTWLTTKIASKLSTELGTRISIGGVNISWFMNGVLEKVEVDDLQDNRLFEAEKISFGLRYFSFKKNKFILSKVELNHFYLAIRTYKGQEDLNLQFILDYFKSSDSAVSKPTVFIIDKIIITDSRFIYDIEHYQRFDFGFDYNHIDLKKLNASIRNFRLDSNKYFANFQQFSAQDSSGFILNNFCGEVELGANGLQIKNLQIETPKSKAYIQLGFEYKRWGNWLDFIDSVSFNSNIDSCQIDFDDIAFFASDLQNSRISFSASGNVKGPISNLKLRSFKLNTGNITHFDGKINISGLPEIEKAFIDVKVNEFATNLNDVNALRLPGNIAIDLPSNLINLQTINVKGRFTGFYNDFVSNAIFETRLGRMTTDILIKPRNDDMKIAYNGKVNLSEFNIGGFFGSEKIKNLSLNGEINGQGIDKNAEAEVNIEIANIQIAKFNYRDSRIVGTLKNRIINATVTSQDSIFKVAASGIFDFSKELPHYRFKADIENARFSRLFQVDADTFGNISGKMVVDASGTDVDNLVGDIFIDSLFYKKSGKVYSGESLRIFSEVNANQRYISLNSKYIDGKIKGQFQFANLADIYPYILKNFIPSMLNSPDQKSIMMAKTIKLGKKPMRFEFDFNLKKTNDLSEILYPSLTFADNTKISGFFNAEKDSLLLALTSNWVSYNSIRSKNLKLKIFNHLDTFDIRATSDQLAIGKIFVYDSIVFNPMVYHDSAQIILSMGKGENHTNSLYINTKLQFLGRDHLKASINELNIWFNDSNWVVNKPNFIEYKSKYLKVDNFDLTSDGNNLIVNGLLTESPYDVMNFSFNNFDLQFFDYYLSKYYVDLGGNITGNLELSNVWNQLNYLAEFKIENFKFNDTRLGLAEINSMWNADKKAVLINMKTQLQEAGLNQQFLDVSGYYYPYKYSENLDLTAKISEFPLASLKPFLASFSSDISGSATGTVAISGELAAPVFLGTLKANVENLMVDYIKTFYSLNDNIVFTKNYFGFENATIYDQKFTNGTAHTGNLNFKLHHENFSKMRLELDVIADNLDMLNTTALDNELFYGYALADGKVSILGPINDIYFNIDVKPMKGSKIAIPMTESASVSNTEFITFIVKDSTTIEVEEEPENFDISMDLRFDMTPDATVQLVMDEKVGDIITANGQGIIRIHMDKMYNVNMFGSYEIVKGDYLFTMENIINKHFILEPGGSIVWEGDLMDARMNMSAIYRTEAKLYDLLQMIDTSDVYKRRSKVDCKINLGGSLATPEISFDIDLPDETNETREKVNMVLYTSSGSSNMDIMNKNFISLIMLGKFQAPGGLTQAANPNALASNATEMLASQMSNWLNKMSDEVDIGLTWDAGDEATSQEIAVALSYKAFNDRLLIDGKFGTGGESKTGEDNTRIVGDFNAELALTKDKNLSAKVFNRTNYEDPVTRKAPYTQGAGIVYRKEFDNLLELFGRTKKTESANSKAIKE